MSIWQKMGSALGAVGGSIATLLRDAAEQLSGAGAGDEDRRPIAFTIGVIALGAKMAKADGVVTDDEIRAFSQIVHIPDGELANVSRFFDMAKRDVAGFEAYARHLSGLFHDHPAVLEDVLEGLFHIAKADGIVHENELAYLERVSQIFGFAERKFEGIKARHVAPREGDPYVILGIDRGASNDEIKKAYRDLAKNNHPDALVSRGVPVEFVAIATEKLARINEAYGRIARERGL